MAEKPNEATIEYFREILREDDIPFYDEEQIAFYIALNNGNYNSALYQMLVRKAEDTTLNVSGMKTNDESSYFKMIAQRYRPNNSGTLG